MTAGTRTTPRGAGIIANWAEYLDVDDETPRLTIASFWLSSSRPQVISIVVPATVSREVI